MILGALGHLAGHGGNGNLAKDLVIINGNFGNQTVQNFLAFFSREAESPGNHRRVDPLIQEFPSFLQKLPSQHHRRGGAVPHRGLLRLGYLDHHLGNGMINIHLPQMVAPSLVTTGSLGSPLALYPMPMGPKVVFTDSAIVVRDYDVNPLSVSAPGPLSAFH